MKAADAVARAVPVADRVAIRAGSRRAGRGLPVAHPELDETVVGRLTSAPRHQAGADGRREKQRDGDAQAGDGRTTAIETARLPCDHARPLPSALAMRTVRTALAGSGQGRQ